ncbi:MAG: Ppx/GppA phosphatase family protein [Acidimicrobiales bacterium]
MTTLTRPHRRRGGPDGAGATTDHGATDAAGLGSGAAPLHAAIDIGTNSFHLVVAQADASGGFDVLTTEKEMVRLGSGAHEMKRLQPDAIERGIAALQRMNEVAQSFGAVDLVAVATSAVREASNGNEFIERARTEAGVNVEVIAGTEEARLIHLGVLQALPVFDRRLILADIGGGSTELLVGEGGEVIEARSMKLGSIRLTQRFFPDGEMTREEHQRAVSTCGPALASVSRELGGHQPEIAIGSSGTISTLAAMAAANRGEELRSVNGVSFTCSELDAVIDSIASTDRNERKDLPGIDPRRVDIITGGAILLSEIFRAFDIDEMTVSSYALREGVLLDRFGGSRTAGLDRLSDLRRANVERMATQLDPDPEHAATCANLAGQLFDRTQRLHGLDANDRELLVCGALLHNVGLFISHSSHHKHGYYVIRNSDRLTGFTQQEIEVIALVARYHRRGRPKERHREFAALLPDEQQKVRILAGLLRIAIGLDRSHAARVQSIRVLVDDEPQRPVLTIEPLAHDDADDLELELYAAGERSKLLADALGVDIVLHRPTNADRAYQSS